MSIQKAKVQQEALRCLRDINSGFGITKSVRKAKTARVAVRRTIAPLAQVSGTLSVVV